MSSHFHLHWVCLIVTLTIIQGIHAVDYTVTINAHGRGGRRFKKDIGSDAAKAIMKKGTYFVQFSVLKQSSAEKRKNVKEINLYIDTRMKDDSSYKSNGDVHEIHLSSNFIRNVPEDGLNTEVTALIYYEITHILQWTADDQSPPAKGITAIKDGIAGFAVLLANYQPRNWVKFGEGARWDQSRDVTAQFLVYCNIRKPGFAAYLNEKMHLNPFKESYFLDFFDENIDDLWKDYKGKHGGQV